MYSPGRNKYLRSGIDLYAFGNTCPRDILESFSFDAIDPIKILCLGCGDLRNALYTLSNRSTEVSFQIYLNDVNTETIARNILILKVITEESFENSDIEYLIDLWYNFIWKKETTRLRFILDLQDLIKSKFPEQIVVNAKQVEELKNVWTRWLSLATSAKFLKKGFILERVQKRQSIFRTSIPTGQMSTEDMFKLTVDMWEKMCLNTDSQFSFQIKGEIAMFVTSGNLYNGDQKVDCVNPTLIDPSTNECAVNSTCFPYFLMGQPKPGEEDIEPSVRFRSTLLWLISSYRQKKEKVKFYFDNSNALEFCYKSPATFDVIDSSNLADHVGLANVIIAAQKILADRETSLLFTQSMSWASLRPDLVDYIEAALGVPVSMIPTIYGLQLTNRLKLGSPKINSILEHIAPTIDFMWRKAPAMDVPFDVNSAEFQDCLKNLQQRCFVLNDQTLWKEENESFGTMAYTPMTLNYLVTSLEKRLRLTNVLNVEVHPLFQATHKAFSDWSKGNQVSLVKWSFPFKDEFCKGENIYYLRVALVRSSSLSSAYQNFEELSQFIKNPTSAGDSVVHFVDNFQMVLKEGQVEISFLLPIDHPIHISYLYYMAESQYVFSGGISEMKKEIFTLNHPYLMGKRMDYSPSTSVILADSCLESKSGYTSNCQFNREDVGVLKVETDKCSPSESCHRIMLSFAKF